MANPYLNNKRNTDENIRFVDRIFKGNELHNETIIELALEELRKFVLKATYELDQRYTKKL
eukprot:1720002-Ditylum_brightwellii.AAC.1